MKKQKTNVKENKKCIGLKGINKIVKILWKCNDCQKEFLKIDDLMNHYEKKQK